VCARAALSAPLSGSRCCCCVHMRRALSGVGGAAQGADGGRGLREVGFQQTGKGAWLPAAIDALQR
jgi:hypothetical protein